MIVPVEADRQARGVLLEDARNSRRIPAEVMRNKRNCGVGIVFFREAEERFEIQEPVALPQKRIVDDD